jgi:glycyl-tRNA synthetase (class II)
MIEVYKIIQGRYDPEASTIIKLMNDTEQRFSTRTNSRKVIYNRANTNIRKNSFSIRIAKYWNKLPENIVNAPSINSLKNRLDKHWKDEELYYANHKVDISRSRVTYREIEEIQESGEEEP